MRHYQDVIHGLDATVNPAGVEANMRLSHGTLDHLTRFDFTVEIEIAKVCERNEPGHLRETAISFGVGEDYDRWEGRKSLGVDEELVLAETYG